MFLRLEPINDEKENRKEFFNFLLHKVLSGKAANSLKMKNSVSKRKFLKKSIALGLGLPLLGTSVFSCGDTQVKDEPTPLKILILGGTSFLGPHQVAYAISRGHKVSTFTRGKTKPTVHKEIFDQVEMLVGDRVDNLSALENREWDVVIDNSGRAADWTKRTAQLLKEKADLYLYVSSTGVYYPHLEAGVDEETKVLLEDPAGADGQLAKSDSFGVMKAKSELEAIEAFGADRTTVVRPTYMVGPADRTDRFMHWPLRLSQGGDVLVPGKATDPVQYIDVRDVAEWIIRLCEKKKAGTYNAAGPKQDQGVLEFVEKASTAYHVDSKLVLVDDYAFLEEHSVGFIIPWIMPTEAYSASALVKNQKAVGTGLSFRDLKDTMKDTLEWWNSDAVETERRRKYEQNPKSIINREQAVLNAWAVLTES